MRKTFCTAQEALVWSLLSLWMNKCIAAQAFSFRALMPFKHLYVVARCVFHVPWWSFIMSGALGPDMSAWQAESVR